MRHLWERDVIDAVEARAAARSRPRDTVRVWVSEFPGELPLVCVAVWGRKPNGYFGITHACEVNTAADWNGVLERLEEVL